MMMMVMWMMVRMRMRDDELAARCSSGLGGTRAFLRYDRPIRSCVEKNESVEGEAARESNLRLVLLMLLQRRVKGPT